MTNALFQLLSNTKTRTLVILTGSLIIGGITIAVLNSNKSDNPVESRPSKTIDIPKSVESTPGAQTSEKYSALQEKANDVGTKQAAEKGDTFVPTITANKPAPTKENNLQDQLLNALEQATNPKNLTKNPLMQDDPRLTQMLAQQQENKRTEELLLKQREAQTNAERLAAINEQKLKAIETVAQAMEEQTKFAVDAWNNVPLQTYTSGDWNAEKEKRAQATTSSSTTKDNPVILKAGNILFAVLETSVNSDEPGPVMARIIQEPFKDARIIGKIEIPAGDSPEKVQLKFDTLNIPGETNSNKINAVAIDPDTARTALASDVDHHYIVRWGSLFASSFMQGYAKAIDEKGSSVQTATTGSTTTTTTSKPNLTGKQQLFEALGEVGKSWGSNIGSTFNRKPTISIESGVGVGLLILSDLKLGELPTPQTNTTVAIDTKTVNPINTLTNPNVTNTTTNTTSNTTQEKK